jgi:D-3-phosphoglycerate dehydrogenase
VDVDFARERGVEVISLKGEREFLDSIYATAEHTLALLLAVLRNVPQAVNHVNEGKWNRDAFKGRELHGSTLGIVGYGRLGTKLAGYGEALGMDVLACDPHTKEDDRIQLVDLETLLSESDYVTLHVPYTESTASMIGAEEFERMKNSGYLINTSRGEIIDEVALIRALRNDEIEGAAVDVVRGEYDYQEDWMRDSMLIQYARDNQNLIITPHIGGATWESMEKTEIYIAEKLKRYFEDSNPV